MVIDLSEGGQTYIVAGTKPWNRQIFEERIRKLPGNWMFVQDKEELTLDLLEDVAPDRIFFLHWSWIVPRAITENYECICFHMTDVPYGRGGTPLQNLILRGHRTTKLSALRMEETLDSGPVYLKEDLDLSGSAQEIFLRANRLAAGMIQRLIYEAPEPVAQEGKVVEFERRTPVQSEITGLESVSQLYDHIRMLDAPDYPPAYIQINGLRFEFRKARLKDDVLVAEVTVEDTDDETA